MPRQERFVSLDVLPADGRQLTDTGGRFQQGLHVVVAKDAVTAWIPEGGRTASGPPKFVGRVTRREQQLEVAGVIREARIDQLNALLWGSLAILMLGIAVGGAVAGFRHRGDIVFALIFAVFALIFAVFGVAGQRGRAATFAIKSARLETSLRSWANPRQ